MPLPNYGVAIGSLVRHYRDDPQNFGSWYHGHVEVLVGGSTWTAALDVSNKDGIAVYYRVSDSLKKSVLGPVATLPPGFHKLASSPASGAVDYIRSPFLRDVFLFKTFSGQLGLPSTPQPFPTPLPLGAPPRLPPPPPRDWKPRSWFIEALRRARFRPVKSLASIRPWTLSNGDNALVQLEAELLPHRRTYLFGARFSNGDNGVHDVHQNQGDPAGSQWWNLNGIWQDGAVAVERADGSLFFWQLRFATQAKQTDQSGHPA